MTTETVLAYLSGAIDSDGYISIKRSTYHQRVRKDARNPVFSEKIGLHQVTPHIPELLKATFGGTCYLAAGQTPNSKPLHRYTASDKNAALACEALLPYLRVKAAQARLALELRESKDSRYWQFSYWFIKENPNWHEMELITTREAMQMLGYTNAGSLSQAIRNGTLVSATQHSNEVERPRIPRLLVEQIVANGGGRFTPPPLVAWRERLNAQIHELNKIGVNGTAIYRQEGHYAPK